MADAGGWNDHPDALRFPPVQAVQERLEQHRRAKIRQSCKREL